MANQRQESRRQPAGAVSASPAPLAANPPRPNFVLFALSIALWLPWLGFLIWLAWLSA